MLPHRGGGIGRCATCVYVDIEAVGSIVAGERVTFKDFTLANAVRGFNASAGGCHIRFENVSSDFVDEVGRISNARVFYSGHIETNDPYLFDMTGNSMLFMSDTELVLAQAHNVVGILSGDAAQLERALAAAERLQDARVMVAALNNLALAHLRAGDAERALPLAERALAVSETLGDRHREAAEDERRRLEQRLAETVAGAERLAQHHRVDRERVLADRQDEPGARDQRERHRDRGRRGEQQRAEPQAPSAARRPVM